MAGLPAVLGARYNGRVRHAGPPAGPRGALQWLVACGGDEASVSAAIAVACAAGYTGQGIIFHNIPYARFMAIVPSSD